MEEEGEVEEGRKGGKKRESLRKGGREGRNGGKKRERWRKGKIQRRWINTGNSNGSE